MYVIDLNFEVVFIPPVLKLFLPVYGYYMGRVSLCYLIVLLEDSVEQFKVFFSWL
jgi:hypothetical protein